MRHLSVVLLLIVVALLFPPHASSVGEGGWECLWGTDCSNPGVNDPTFVGDVTADGFIVNPHATLGGGFTLKECEGGAGCEDAGDGSSATVKLPDNEDEAVGPVGTNKVYGGFRTCGFSLDEGVNQFTDDQHWRNDTGRMAGTGYGAGEDYAMWTQGCFTENSIYIHNCYVVLNSGGNNWGNALDYYQFELVFEDFENTTTTVAANEFTVKDDAFDPACSTTSCIGGSLLNGAYLWEVHEGHSAANGRWSVGIVNKAHVDTGTANSVDLLAICEYW